MFLFSSLWLPALLLAASSFQLAAGNSTLAAVSYRLS
jgi:hypothetical protein